MKILLISSYPHAQAKSQSVFVYRLMQSLAKLGCEIVVVSPQNWRTKVEGDIELPGEKSYGPEVATVYRPKYFDFPNSARLGDFTLGKYNAYTYRSAVKRVVKNLNFTPDIVYAHFLYRPGPSAIWAAKHFKVPAVVALGESTLEKHISIFGEKNMKSLIHQFSGIVSVSQKNKKYAVDELGVNENKVKVFHNAVNHDVFYQRNKAAMREKYNFPQDKFIVVFNGHFIERKGPLRVLEALNQLDENIAGIFIGSGKQEPYGKKVLFKGRIPFQEVPELLSAADCFVLPTLNEGSCNAVTEALACGLPIISSDIEAVREQVNTENAILVNPKSVEEIKTAIESLYKNEKRHESMQEASLKAAALSSSKKRAEGIKKFLLNIVSTK